MVRSIRRMARSGRHRHDDARPGWPRTAGLASVVVVLTLVLTLASWMAPPRGGPPDGDQTELALPGLMDGDGARGPSGSVEPGDGAEDGAVDEGVAEEPEGGAAERPAVWVISDLSTPDTTPRALVGAITVGLLADRMNVRRIVVGATARSDRCAGAAPRVSDVLGVAYERSVVALRTADPRFPQRLPISQAGSCGRPFDYFDAAGGPSTAAQLAYAARRRPLVVLNTAPLTELATALRILDGTGGEQTPELSVIAVGSAYEARRCRADAAACSYVHEQVARGRVRLHELGEPWGANTLDAASCAAAGPVPRPMAGDGGLGDLLDRTWPDGAPSPDLTDAAPALLAAGSSEELGRIPGDGRGQRGGLRRLCPSWQTISDRLTEGLTAAGM